MAPNVWAAGLTVVEFSITSYRPTDSDHRREAENGKDKATDEDSSKVPDPLRGDTHSDDGEGEADVAEYKVGGVTCPRASAAASRLAVDTLPMKTAPTAIPR